MFTHLDGPEAAIHVHNPIQWDYPPCLLLVMCQDCVNPVSQVCVHLLWLSPAADWVSRVPPAPDRVTGWTADHSGLPSEEQTVVDTRERANPCSSPSDKWPDSQCWNGPVLSYLLIYIYFLNCTFQLLLQSPVMLSETDRKACAFPVLCVFASMNSLCIVQEHVKMCVCVCACAYCMHWHKKV